MRDGVGVIAASTLAGGVVARDAFGRAAPLNGVNNHPAGTLCCWHIRGERDLA